MSKKTFTILIIIFVIIALLGIGIVWYLSIEKKNGGAAPGLKDFFPFGKPSTTIIPPPQTNQPSGTTGPTGPTGPQPIPRLRKVSNNPVVGYFETIKQVPVDPNSIPAPKQVPINATFTFSKDLKLGTKSSDVKELQKELNQCIQTQVASKGVGSPGKEGTVFNAATAKAVTTFQELFPGDILTPQNLTKGNGIVDEYTRKKLNAGFLCTLPTSTATTIPKEVIRYIERGTSNIYDALADTLAATRLSNTTIPRVHDAFFANNGQTIIMRSLEEDNQTIDTFIGSVPEPVPGGDALPQLNGSLMPKNIEDISISPDTQQIFFMVPSGNNLIGFTSNLDGTGQKRVFSSPFFGWLSQWATPQDLVFTAKASGLVTGFAYDTNLQSGGFTKIVGPITGLTTLMSPDGKYILLGITNSSGLNLMLMTVATKQIKDLKLHTLPEKCVWNKTSTTIYCSVPDIIPTGSIYPDDWYQGTVISSDSFWAIDVTGIYGTQNLFTPSAQGGESTDGIHLGVDDANKYLYFMNKDTGILWQYDLAPTPPDTSTTDTTASTTDSASGTTTSTGTAGTISSPSNTTTGATTTGTANTTTTGATGGSTSAADTTGTTSGGTNTTNTTTGTAGGTSTTTTAGQ